MCYDRDARPPLPPIAGAAVEGERFALISGDGTSFAAYGACAERLGGPGVVILPDVRGLHAFYEELAQRFAEQGIHALAMDYFGRTAGVAERRDNFDFMPHVQATKANQVHDDVSAAMAYLRSPDGGDARQFFVVGFCFGGGHAFSLAASDLGLRGVVGFYGRPVGPTRDGTPAPIDVVDRMSCPLLGLFGGADQAIAPAAVAEFEQALTRANVPHELHTYEGAPHSFFDRRAEEYAEASADAWRRMLAFIEQNTAATRQ